jgi:hypothetical protein
MIARHNVRAADGLGFIVRTLNHFERKSKCPPAQPEAYRSVSAIVHNILFEEPALVQIAEFPSGTVLFCGAGDVDE